MLEILYVRWNDWFFVLKYEYKYLILYCTYMY